MAETAEPRPPGAEEAARDITRDTKAFTAALRIRIFTFLRALSLGDLAAALAALPAHDIPTTGPWTEEKLRARVTEYHVGHRAILLDPDARNIRHTYILPAEDKQTWRVQQVLVDPEGHNDWIAEFVVDLPASRTVGEPVWGLGRIAPLS